MEMELRQRRKPAAFGDNVPDEKGNIKTSQKIDQTFTRIICVILLFLMIILGGSNLFPDHPVSVKAVSIFDSTLNKLGLAPKVYAVVLDAGSTGSRVLAFTFHKNPVTSVLVLEDELFAEVKPGLSSFAHEPTKAAEAIHELLEKAKSRIPEDMWRKSPVALKATAGLRLLPTHESSAIIEQVSQVIKASGFLVVDPSSVVEIMSELDEGLFGWFTINFLMGYMHKIPKSYAALDLGGGSTQITFAPKRGSTLVEAPPAFLHHVDIQRNKIPIYSRSYLGLGLMAAREAIFAYSNPSNSSLVRSPCMTGRTPEQWEFHGKRYRVSSSGDSGYEKCTLVVHHVINSLAVHPPDELPTRKIAAFSYFYDRAVDSGILEKGQSKVVEVQDFLDAAKRSCDNPTQPFLCTDVTFIANLLHHGYRLAANAKLGLYKIINGHETSWALGAAFSLLEKV